MAQCHLTAAVKTSTLIILSSFGIGLLDTTTCCTDTYTCTYTWMIDSPCSRRQSSCLTAPRLLPLAPSSWQLCVYPEEIKIRFYSTKWTVCWWKTPTEGLHAVLLLTIFNLLSVGKSIIEYEFLFLFSISHSSTVLVSVIFSRMKEREQGRRISSWVVFLKVGNHYVLNRK